MQLLPGQRSIFHAGAEMEKYVQHTVHELAELLCIPDDAVRAEGGRAGVGTEICYFMRV